MSAAVVFKKVDPRYYKEYVGYAGWLHGGADFPMLQCVWPLKSGLFPWDAVRFYRSARSACDDGALHFARALPAQLISHI